MLLSFLSSINHISILREKLFKIFRDTCVVEPMADFSTSHCFNFSEGLLESYLRSALYSDSLNKPSDMAYYSSSLYVYNNRNMSIGKKIFASFQSSSENQAVSHNWILVLEAGPRISFSQDFPATLKKTLGSISHSYGTWVFGVIK